MEERISLEHHLVAIARAYAIAMNEIENRIFELAQADSRGLKDYFEEYRKLYQPVFLEYATGKKRVYGGQANSYGRPTRYDGINEETNGKTTLKSPNRAEVHFETANAFHAEYLFVLLKEAGVWKIDNVKYKWYHAPKWSPLTM
ncbi:NTF2 fold immunity protein [Taibaiella koreensis]|uniref:NTF2 fold immunity protein n=1 Tax=Taibaiella koreensis TaxID=1268548 RepID=UPI000E59ADE8|nr:NTF2 fold immunity protein [Taibaiella koreensis]